MHIAGLEIADFSFQDYTNQYQENFCSPIQSFTLCYTATLLHCNPVLKERTLALWALSLLMLIKQLSL